jgi:hypothetical protein
MDPATSITDVDPRALATEHGIFLILELSLLNYDHNPTDSGCVLVQTVN